MMNDDAWVDQPATEKIPWVPKDSRTIQERFLVFHRTFPQVYDLMVGFARQARRRGFKTYGIRPIVERARWEVSMTWGPDVAGFKLNNDFCSRYARMMMTREPDLVDFFRTRKLQRR